jgi:hypothetical protein
VKAAREAVTIADAIRSGSPAESNPILAESNGTKEKTDAG